MGKVIANPDIIDKCQENRKKENKCYNNDIFLHPLGLGYLLCRQILAYTIFLIY